MFTFNRKCLLTLALFVASTTTFAKTQFCTFTIISGGCQTETITPNTEGKYIRFDISPFTNYEVIDNTTKNVVTSGYSGNHRLKDKVSNLEGKEYSIKVNAKYAGYAYINNDL